MLKGERQFWRIVTAPAALVIWVFVLFARGVGRAFEAWDLN
jgi:hypothetical protein